MSKFGMIPGYKKWTPPTGITNAWLFEEVASSVIDTVGSAHLSINGITFPVGLVGNCANFGSGSSLGYASNIFGNVCSFSFSIKLSSVSSVGVFGQSYDSGGGTWTGWGIAMSANGIYLHTGDNGHTVYTRTFVHGFTLNEWHNIAITKYGSTWKVYYGDAIEIAGSGNIINKYLDRYFKIGMCEINYILGAKQIDQFRGYNNYILTDEDIIDLNNHGKGR